MGEHPVNSWSRVQVLGSTFFGICEDSYSCFLDIEKTLKTMQEESEKKLLLERKYLQMGLKTIVFAGLCLEAAIYDYASIQLGDKFVREHFEKLDLLSKWIVIPRFICGKQIRKDRAPYAAVKHLVADRNKLVHHKSKKYIPDNQDFLEKLEEDNIAFEKAIHNAYRALVLLSLEMDYLVGKPFNPLIFVRGTFTVHERPSNLAPIIEDYKEGFERSKEHDTAEQSLQPDAD